MIYLKLFLIFLKIGAFTFGGGYAMLPLIMQEVAGNQWMTGEELLDFVAVSESTPGPFAVNAATFVGSRLAGVFGAFFATLGVVLPSFVIILIIAKAYKRFQSSRPVRGAMLGLKGAVVGLIGAAVISTAESELDWQGIRMLDAGALSAVGLLAVAAFLLHKRVHPIIVLIGAAGAGILIKGVIGL